MRVLAYLVIASAPIDPYNMTSTICATQGDRIDSDACMQQAFDQLWRAEADAIAHARQAEVESEGGAKATGAAATALAWAIDQVLDVLKKHTNETYSWSFF